MYNSADSVPQQDLSRLKRRPKYKMAGMTRLQSVLDLLEFAKGDYDKRFNPDSPFYNSGAQGKRIIEAANYGPRQYNEWAKSRPVEDRPKGEKHFVPQPAPKTVRGKTVFKSDKMERVIGTKKLVRPKIYEGVKDQRSKYHIRQEAEFQKAVARNGIENSEAFKNVEKLKADFLAKHGSSKEIKDKAQEEFNKAAETAYQKAIGDSYSGERAYGKLSKKDMGTRITSHGKEAEETRHKLIRPEINRVNQKRAIDLLESRQLIHAHAKQHNIPIRQAYKEVESNPEQIAASRERLREHTKLKLDEAVARHSKLKSSIDARLSEGAFERERPAGESPVPRYSENADMHATEGREWMAHRNPHPNEEGAIAKILADKNRADEVGRTLQAGSPNVFIRKRARGLSDPDVQATKAERKVVPFVQTEAESLEAARGASKPYAKTALRLRGALVKSEEAASGSVKSVSAIHKRLVNNPEIRSKILAPLPKPPVDPMAGISGFKNTAKIGAAIGAAGLIAGGAYAAHRYYANKNKPAEKKLSAKDRVIMFASEDWMHAMVGRGVDARMESFLRHLAKHGEKGTPKAVMAEINKARELHETSENTRRIRNRIEDNPLVNEVLDTHEARKRATTVDRPHEKKSKEKLAHEAASDEVEALHRSLKSHTPNQAELDKMESAASDPRDFYTPIENKHSLEPLTDKTPMTGRERQHYRKGMKEGIRKGLDLGHEEFIAQNPHLTKKVEDLASDTKKLWEDKQAFEKHRHKVVNQAVREATEGLPEKVLAEHGARIRTELLQTHLANEAVRAKSVEDAQKAAAQKVTDVNKRSSRDKVTWAMAGTGAGVAAGGTAGVVAGRYSKKKEEQKFKARGRVIYFDNEPIRRHPALVAGASAALTGAIIGGGHEAIKIGSTVGKSLKGAAFWGGLGGTLVGGGTLLGSQILGKPRQDEKAAVTKRAAVGGAILGTGAGLAAGLIAHHTKTGLATMDKYAKIYRPVDWMKRGGTAGAMAIGAGAGAIGGGLQAADEGQQADTLNALRKKNLSAKGSVIRFAQTDPVTGKVAVAPDRYKKLITSNEHERRNRNYARSALVGGVLGVQFRGGTKIGRAALIGAGAGLATQAVVRNAVTGDMKDRFGEKTITAKRVDLAPWVAGGALAAGTAATRIYKKSPTTRQLVHKYFSSTANVVRFGTVDTSGMTDDQRKELMADRRMAKNMMYSRRRDWPAAQELYKKASRAGGLFKDAHTAMTGASNVDAKGRERTPEWKKPWVRNTALTVGVGGGLLVGGLTVRNMFTHAPVGSGRHKIGEAFKRGDVHAAAREIIPGYKAVSRTWRGATEEMGKLVDPIADKAAVKVGEIKPFESDAVKSEKAKIDANQRKVDAIRQGKTTLASKGRPIYFAEVVPNFRTSDERGNSVRIHAPNSQKRNREEQSKWNSKNAHRLYAAGAAATAAVGIPVMYKMGGKKRAEEAAKTAAREIMEISRAEGSAISRSVDPYVKEVAAERVKIQKKTKEIREADKARKLQEKARRTGTDFASKSTVIHFRQRDSEEKVRDRLSIASKVAGVGAGAAVLGAGAILGGKAWKKAATHLPEAREAFNHVRVAGSELAETINKEEGRIASAVNGDETRPGALQAINEIGHDVSVHKRLFTKAQKAIRSSWLGGKVETWIKRRAARISQPASNRIGVFGFSERRDTEERIRDRMAITGSAAGLATKLGVIGGAGYLTIRGVGAINRFPVSKRIQDTRNWLVGNAGKITSGLKSSGLAIDQASAGLEHLSKEVKTDIITRKPRAVKLSSRLPVITFAKKKEDHAGTVAAIGGGAGLVIGSQIHGGRPIRPGEDITGKRVTRRHLAFPFAIHEGIGIGGDQVAEVYRYGHNPLGGPAEVKTIHKDKFGHGNKVLVIDEHPHPEAAKNAKNRIGEKLDLNLITNNCQDFTDSVRGQKKPLSRQWRRAAYGAAVLGGAGYVGAKLYAKHQQEKKMSAKERVIEFAKKEEKHPMSTGRKIAIGAGVATAAAGASLLPGAAPMLRIAGRDLVKKGREEIFSPKLDLNEGGKMVADYIASSNKSLGSGLHGKVVGAALNAGINNPSGVVGKSVRKLPMFRAENGVSPEFKLSHFARFRAGPLQALGHWDWEVGHMMEHRAKPAINAATGRSKASQLGKPWKHPETGKHVMLPAEGDKPARVKTNLDHFHEQMHYNREAAHAEIQEQMYKHGKSEAEAVKHVGYNSQNPKTQAYFNTLAQTKAKVSGTYAKWATIPPALVVGGAGLATVGALHKQDNGDRRTRRLSAILDLVQLGTKDDKKESKVLKGTAIGLAGAAGAVASSAHDDGVAVTYGYDGKTRGHLSQAEDIQKVLSDAGVHATTHSQTGFLTGLTKPAMIDAGWGPRMPLARKVPWKSDYTASDKATMPTVASKVGQVSSAKKKTIGVYGGGAGMDVASKLEHINKALDDSIHSVHVYAGSEKENVQKAISGMGESGKRYVVHGKMNRRAILNAVGQHKINIGNAGLSTMNEIVTSGNRGIIWQAGQRVGSKGEAYPHLQHNEDWAKSRGVIVPASNEEAVAEIKKAISGGVSKHPAARIVKEGVEARKIFIENTKSAISEGRKDRLKLAGGLAVGAAGAALLARSRDKNQKPR